MGEKADAFISPMTMTAPCSCWMSCTNCFKYPFLLFAIKAFMGGGGCMANKVLLFILSLATGKLYKSNISQWTLFNVSLFKSLLKIAIEKGLYSNRSHNI